MALKTKNSRLHKDEENGSREEKASGNLTAAFQCIEEDGEEDRARLCRGAWQEDENHQLI